MQDNISIITPYHHLSIPNLWIIPEVFVFDYIVYTHYVMHTTQLKHKIMTLTVFFLIGKLHMHQVDLEPATTPSHRS
jgi:hypothetical protein